MVTVLKNHFSQPVVPMRFTCLFERAEHMLETLIFNRDGFDAEQATLETIALQQNATTTPLSLVRDLETSDPVQRRTHAGLLLHQDILVQLTELSVKCHAHGI